MKEHKQNIITAYHEFSLNILAACTEGKYYQCYGEHLEMCMQFEGYPNGTGHKEMDFQAHQGSALSA